MNDSALSLLQNTFGYAEFRGEQATIVAHVASGKSALVLMPTGGGKSLCYQIPALLRDGLTVVISPLIALMQNQVAALLEVGVTAATLNNASPYAEQQRIIAAARAGELKLLYVSPERLLSPRFLDFLASLPSLGLFAIDEAHCVSQWGHDFRPEYQQLGILAQRFPSVPRLALTATADQQTREDILHFLQLESARVFLASFDRPNLFYQIIEKNNAKKQLLAFIKNQHRASSGIVYCLSRKRVDDFAAFLCQEGLRALPYHAGMTYEERQRNQEQFLREDNLIMVATVAFGMGIDKPDVRFVAHVDMPQSLESFYQESGRAGRDGLAADSWLCYGLNDLVFLKERIVSSEKEATQKEVELHKLEAMNSLCETVACRRLAILAYFNESTLACGHCDNCVNPPVTQDMTHEVRQVLSAIYRCGQRCSASHIIDVLMGRNTPAVNHAAHHTLSVFGIGQALKEKQWRAIIRQLLSLKIIDVALMYHQALFLTDAARPLLKGTQTLELKPFSTEKKVANTRNAWLKTERQEQLWQTLRVWRKKMADSHNTPAYVIFGDLTLRALVEKQPTTLAELAKIEGLGEKKRHQYGAELCQLILNNVQQNNTNAFVLP